MNTTKKIIFKRDQAILLAAGMAITIFMILLFTNQPQILSFLELKIYDQYIQRYHKPAATGVPVIIDLDEKSLTEKGQWPWPRYRVALLMKYLQAYGAAAVATDIIFVEPDRTSPQIIRRDVLRDLKFSIDFTGLPADFEDYDRLLAANLAGGPFVLAIDFMNPTQRAQKTLPPPHECPIVPIKVAVIASPGAISPHDVLPRGDHMICPIPTLAKTGNRTGFITIAPDADSVYRRAPLLYSYHNQIYPSLALASLMQAMDTDSIILKMCSVGIESIKIKGTVIPTDHHGRLLVNYRGKMKTFEYISASDVLNRKLPDGALQGRIALIGTSASGLKDLRPTPLDPHAPGVETHATIIDNILSNQFIVIPDWVKGIEFSGMVAAGLLTTLLLMWARASWLILPLIGLGYAMWYGSVLIFQEQRYFLSPLYSYLTLGLTFTTLTMLKFWREERAKKFIHGAFAHYLAPSVISQIMNNPEALTLEGQEKDITIQFSDVRNFTSLSEQLTPTQVTDLLHDYLTPMTRIITEHHGTLDKFIGDAVMAFWNAPLDVPNHQQHAVTTALAQLAHLETLNEEFLETYGFAIAIGIGIHSGPVRVGNMGSADLFDYTLIGDNVNLASRLEGLTKYYGQKLVVSQSIVDACDATYHFRQLDTVRVKGKHKPVTIYTVYTANEADARKEELDLSERAHQAYLAMDFKKAKTLFTELHETGNDTTLYTVYIERCDHLVANPPDSDWDGVFTHKSK
ncbi:CHASE2 domain-containing protein [Pseudodesulfovibrio sp. JC047]|uniref:CHASE2 domain-containing protein n=1 Tax=Pseudodesulfovibrio sp. JC047 TaxID=2683199 RepID=UPI0013D80E76|nr:adenylate/guanylate cyclase domain-containing protein [Pseudodesulfovibrio sp. JC047]NDV20144.1 CHASE2 domain-containing protein [Pseudodesulfovibrio sp. JC047]